MTTMQSHQLHNIAPKLPASLPAPTAARAETPAATPPPPPTMPSLASSQNVALVRPAPSKPEPGIQALNTAWVNAKLPPFLHYACIDLGLSASQLDDYVVTARLWTYVHPTPPSAADEDLLFERIFMSVMNRHNTTDTDTDTEIAPYTTRLAPLSRYLVRCAMTKGTYELFDRK